MALSPLSLSSHSISLVADRSVDVDDKVDALNVPLTFDTVVLGTDDEGVTESHSLQTGGARTGQQHVCDGDNVLSAPPPPAPHSIAQFPVGFINI